MIPLCHSLGIITILCQEANFFQGRKRRIPPKMRPHLVAQAGLHGGWASLWVPVSLSLEGCWGFESHCWCGIQHLGNQSATTAKVPFRVRFSVLLSQVTSEITNSWNGDNSMKLDLEMVSKSMQHFSKLYELNVTRNVTINHEDPIWLKGKN